MISKPHHSSQHSVPSPDGALIATLQQSSLNISTHTGRVIRSFTLAANFVANCRFIRWSRLDSSQHPTPQLFHSDRKDKQPDWQRNRVLLADDDSVHAYDVNDSQWSATIERASGKFGKIANIAFGYSTNEVVVFSDFGIKVIIWSLVTSRGIEIRNPKYTVQCYSYRPTTGHMAVLTRPAAQDVLMILDPESHNLIKSIGIPSVDAQEVVWSLDGRWLAVRDAASSGHNVFIYTADGHLFRTYSGAESNGEVRLGVKRIEWVPSTGLLALGDYNDNVTILGKNTFTPIAYFAHSAPIELSGVSIWQEQLDVHNYRSYTIAPQPASPPTSISSSKTMVPSRGVSIIASSTDGSLLATKDDIVPTTVWIWSLHAGTAIAVLIHHSSVKHISWHPTEAELLLIHCAIHEPCVHLWKSTWEAPRILNLPLGMTGGKLNAHWLLNPDISQFSLLLSSTHQYNIALLSSAGEIVPQSENEDEELAGPIATGGETMFDEGNSLDLSPIKIAHGETIDLQDGNDSSGSGFEMGNEMVDDTFHYRRHIRAIG